MNSNIEGIELRKKNVIITGNFGSGKSEVAVNYVLKISEHYNNLSIVDLDIVNPYFRCREAQELMEKHGIRVVVPTGGYKSADLPIILPEIKGAIENTDNYTILDVGGDPVGARVLRYFGEAFTEDNYDLFVVLNTNRPFTQTIDGCLKMIKSIQDASVLKVTGIIGNTHLMTETTKDTILKGYNLIKEVVAQLKLPIKFIAIENEIFNSNNFNEIDCPILQIDRLLVPSWFSYHTESGNILSKFVSG